MKKLDFSAMENIQGGGGCNSYCNPCNSCSPSLSLAIVVSLTLGCLLGIGAGVGVSL